MLIAVQLCFVSLGTDSLHIPQLSTIEKIKQAEMSSNLSHSNLDRTCVVFNIMSFAGKTLIKNSFGPLQHCFLAENISTMPNC